MSCTVAIPPPVLNPAAGVPAPLLQAIVDLCLIRREMNELLDEHGLLRRGVLVRHVRAPLPDRERAAVEEYLQALPTGTRVSRIEHFTELE